MNYFFLLIKLLRYFTGIKSTSPPIIIFTTENMVVIEEVVSSPSPSGF